MKVLIACGVLAALCCAVYGAEVACATASASCIKTHAGLNRTCEATKPLRDCLINGGCDNSDTSYKAQAIAYNFDSCDGAGAVLINFSLVVAMVSLVQFFTR